MTQQLDSFQARSTLEVGGKAYTYYRLGALADAGFGDIATLPYSTRVLLENLLRNEDGVSVNADDVKTVAASSCRTSPACPPWSTSPRCATRWWRWAGIRSASTRCSPPIS